MKNYEIVKWVSVNTGRTRYSWRHLPNTKPITMKQAKWLDERIAYLNEVDKYE